MDKCLVVFLVGCFMLTATLAVDLYGECTDDENCTTVGSKCKKNVDLCENGICTCEDGKMRSTDATAGVESCKTKIMYGGACLDNKSTGICAMGLQCLDNQCQCSAGTTGDYKTAVNRCTTKKLLGETCGNVDDCFFTTGAECAVMQGSAGTKCKCKAGYKADNDQCRKPRFGEICTTTVGCQKEISNTDIRDPTCQSQGDEMKCACASGAREYDIKYMSMSRTFCSNETDGYKANGVPCSTMLECKSNICAPDLCKANHQTSLCQPDDNERNNGSRSLSATCGLVLLALTIFLTSW